MTDTDVAQSEAQLAAAEATLHGAESTLTTTRANYRRIIGVDAGNLSPASSVERMAPSTLPAAIAAGAAENPRMGEAPGKAEQAAKRGCTANSENGSTD